MKTISIHQPNFMPWIPYFQKIAQSDIFILYDDAQYLKNEFQNRNKIRVKQGKGWTYLTIPLLSKDCYLTPIDKVKFPPDKSWAKKMVKAIKMSYSKTPNFIDVNDAFLEHWLLTTHQIFDCLADFNIVFIETMIGYLNLDGQTVCSSELKIDKTHYFGMNDNG